MTSPGPECTCRELEKRQDDARSAGQGYRSAVFAIRPWVDIVDKLENYRSFLDIYVPVQLEGLHRGTAIGLRDGTISSDGLDTFKLGYEFVRDEIGMRRKGRKRQTSHDDKVAIVKTAQSV